VKVGENNKSVHFNALHCSLDLDVFRCDSEAWWAVTKTTHVYGGSSNTEGKNKARTRRTNAKHAIT